MMYKCKHTPQVYIYNGAGNSSNCNFPEWFDADCCIKHNICLVNFGETSKNTYLQVDHTKYLAGSYFVLFLGRLLIYENKDAFFKDFEAIR